MRVISGYLKGRNILGYNIPGTRPTMDRVKESMFASIQDYIDNSTVLDLFCGTGSLGIEALSMGSNKCYFVDNGKEILKYLINYELEKKKNELREKVRNDTREYWGTTRISQEEFEKSFKRNYKLEEGKWVREEVNLKEIREAVLKEINIYGSTNILSNTWERPKADQIAKLTPANPENTATYDNVKRAQPIGREGAQPPKQSTTIETR